MEKIKKGFPEQGNGIRNQSLGHRPVGLMEMLELTKAKIELENFSIADRAFAAEITLIIAEVMRLPETAEIRIEGNRLSARMVQEVYAMIEKEHVEAVIRAYRNARYEIRHKKTYIRTALYNSVFEMESGVENQFSSEE